MSLPDDQYAMVNAVRARTFLENAKAELPAYEDEIERAMDLLWRLDFASAKAIVIGLFEHCTKPPENLSHALMLIVVTLGEPVEPILKYLKISAPPAGEE